MKLTGESLFIGAIGVAAAAAVVIDAAAFGHGVRVLAFPAAIATAMIAMIVLRLSGIIRTGGGDATGGAGHADSASRDAMGWLAAAFGAVAVVGATIALPAIALLYARNKGAGWAASMALSIAMFTLVYGVFGLLLGKSMPSLLGLV